MSEGRNKLKKHVRAAKEWLGAAEESLDRQEDLEGDLNVMLAKAELQRAAETVPEAAGIVWAKRLLPLLVAAVLAYGAVSFWGKPARENLPERALPSAEERLRTEVPAQKEALLKAEVPAERKIPAKPSESSGEAAEPFTTMVEENRDTLGTVAPVGEETNKSTLPDEEMQKLMCAAGQSLRAQ